MWFFMKCISRARAAQRESASDSKSQGIRSNMQKKVHLHSDGVNLRFDAFKDQHLSADYMVTILARGC
jgi:hypothetical protein